MKPDDLDLCDECGELYPHHRGYCSLHPAALDRRLRTELERRHTFRSIWDLWAVIVLLVILTLAGCALVFRWTSTPPEAQPYSVPLRTRPPR